MGKRAKHGRLSYLHTPETRWMPVIPKRFAGQVAFVAYGGYATSDKAECQAQCNGPDLARFKPKPVQVTIFDGRRYIVVPKSAVRRKSK